MEISVDGNGFNAVLKGKKKVKFSREAALLISVLINSMGVDIMSRSGFGIAQISSVPYVFSKTFPNITFGTFNYIFQTMLIVSLMVIGKKIKAGYAFSFVVGIVFGVMLDIHNLWVSLLPTGPVLNIIYFVLSYFILCTGVCLANNSMLPIIPTDTFPRDLSVMLGKPYNVVKTTFDLCCLFTTVVISVGIGTFILAFTMGKVITVINTKVNNIFEFYNAVNLKFPAKKLALISHIHRI